MNNINWQTVSAIVSAIFAAIAAGISIYTVRRTLWLSALVALEQRFSQISHAKIDDPDSWESICKDATLSNPAKHLVFETFQFYHQAFVLYRRRAIKKADYDCWFDRMKSDIENIASYRKWWKEDQHVFHSSWNKEFVAQVNAEIESVEKANSTESHLPNLTAESGTLNQSQIQATKTVETLKNV